VRQGRGKAETRDRLIRRAKVRAASERQMRARAEALTSARHLALDVLAGLNDADRDPATRAEARRRRGTLPIPGLKITSEDQREMDADEAEGVSTARKLLERWDIELVSELLRQVEVKGAEWVLQPNGNPALEPRCEAGPLAALFAKQLAQTHFLLRSVDGGTDPFKRRIKRCDNPTCRKWFFDPERGTRKWCCTACGNAHRQLKLAGEKYRKRLKSGDYEQRRCPCSRSDCDG